MIDRFFYKCFGKLDNMLQWISNLTAPRCKCKRKKKK